ncbi:MAG: hypothetical protein KF708_11380 [Pirellulales bacterium]|nr:hypothetical protein [Pirellulales bacterium]
MTGLRSCLVLGLLSLALPARAQDEVIDLSQPLSVRSPDKVFSHGVVATGKCCAEECCCRDCWFQPGWFVGLGGSFNSVRVDQTFSGTGTTHIYQGSQLVAVGAAGGPAPTFRDTETTFAPAVQFGYLSQATDSGWMWGTKFLYKYLGVSFSDNNVDAPQVGVFTELSDPTNPSTFTGNAISDSIQTSVNHQLALVPLIGRTVGQGHLYLGGGPVVFQTDSRMYGLYSFADINGQHTDIGGPAVNLSSSDWMWGGLWQLGYAYYLRPSCFIDFSYDFAVTGKYTTIYPMPIANTQGANTYETMIEYKNVQRVWAQSLTITFNLTF